LKIFDKAVLKLTAIYTLIIACVCLSFSVVIFTTATNEMNRGIPVSRMRGTPIEDVVAGGGFQINEEIREIIRQRNAEVRAALLVQLIIINIVVVSTGALASLLLARRTLQPIDEAYEAQSRFVSDASHELRTPLTAIAMENEVLLRDKAVTKDEYKTQVQSNLEEISKLQRLTNYLLQLGKKEQITLTQVRITDVVDDVVRKYTHIASRKHIIIKTKVLDAQVSANHDALTTILGTMVENAIKYSPSKSTISIKFADNKLSVVDQGPGIAEADLPHIFERFYRAETSRTSDGYGLGLALAQQLASQMNLKLTAQNNSQKGATFSIIFSKSSATKYIFDSK